jgi:hypothetical protein
MSKPDIKVVLGAHNLDDQGLNFMEVRNIIIHPDYDPIETRFTGDIALLRLKNQVTFNDRIRPVCLPEEDIKTNKGT